ncbi:UNVERIFIED_CONTAM: hypothetical protein Sindi_1233100 [Sesamum indicum]
MGQIYGKESQLEPLIPPNSGRSVGRPSKARRLQLDEHVRKHKKRGQGRSLQLRCRDNNGSLYVATTKRRDTTKTSVLGDQLILQGLQDPPLTQDSENEPVYHDQPMHESSQLPPTTEDSQTLQKLTVPQASEGIQVLQSAPITGPISGVTIRAHVPFSTNHPAVPSQPQTRSSFKGLVPTLDKDGKKYVNMSNLALVVYLKSKKK